MRKLAITVAIIGICITTAQARQHYYHHGLICGATQMSYFGIRDPKFRLARSWLSFPRTTPHPGAVVFNWRNGRDSAGHHGGHVSRIVAMSDCSHAIVADEVGTHPKNICGLPAVQPR